MAIAKLVSVVSIKVFVDDSIGKTMTREMTKIHDSLNPIHSVMVDACAGTGKTWLLVSRILRLLLDGVSPKHIIAITFTRKAAAEMQDRLQEWCRSLAFENDSWVQSFLLERGITKEVLPIYVPRARALYQLNNLQSGVCIYTFDEWFLSLIRQAPLSCGVPIDVKPGIDRLALRQEAWLTLLQQLSQKNASSSLVTLIEEMGTESVKRILFEAANYRVEWLLFKRAHQPEQLWNELDFKKLHARDPQNVFLDTELIHLSQQMIQCLSQLAPALQRTGRELAQLIEHQSSVMALLKWTYTQEGFGTPRQALINGLRNVHQEELINQWIDVLEQYREGYLLTVNRTLNIRLYECVDAYLKELTNLKNNYNEADFSDIALWVYQLLCDPVEAPYWFHRLDSRFQHVLVDEFQDTSPIQWHILKQWFTNAKEAGSPLTLFLVGDPKQAIYRFRRSDSRIFEEARELLLSHYGAVELILSQSYRSHYKIIELVNCLFENKPHFPYVVHQPKTAAQLGSVKLLLSQHMPPKEKKEPVVNHQRVLRNPLREARTVEDVSPNRALTVAQHILEAVGKRQVLTSHGEKVVEFSDILILARRRQTLIEVEEVLRNYHIPFMSQQKGQLLFYLEIEDLLSLLKVLVYPADNIHLAQVLKSPIFRLTDESLLDFTSDELWWDQLSTSTLLAPIYNQLTVWKKLAQELPVHDLLETIVDQGQVFNAYQSCLSAERFYQAKANIEAFLEFTLSWQSGRYPNLVEFLQEMDTLREDEAQAPDQGIQSDSSKAVRLMTIHGAKGLESPIVWLIDHDGWNPKNKSNYWHVNWSPSNDHPDYFVYMPEKKLISQSQLHHIEKETALLEREEDNLFYVALTRAQSELYVLGGIEDKQTQWINALVSLAQSMPELITIETLTVS
ncbi:MAG: UvrD-helicase domain-containing protein [Betaproteobacteria bacterium]|nr:UvrD-helicase domain-containing protein [Betaproteobacteria bacterium]